MYLLGVGWGGAVHDLLRSPALDTARRADPGTRDMDLANDRLVLERVAVVTVTTLPWLTSLKLYGHVTSKLPIQPDGWAGGMGGEGGGVRQYAENVRARPKTPGLPMPRRASPLGRLLVAHESGDTPSLDTARRLHRPVTHLLGPCTGAM